MIKRIILFITIAIVTGGMVWAQFSGLQAGEGYQGIVDLNAVPTLSIEQRNSAGMFSSDVDDFIDPRFYNPELGTFFFVGADIPGNSDVNFGFATNITDSMYMALYYGGQFVTASGNRNREFTGSVPQPDVRNNTSVWRSDLAVLLGIANMGFRLDVIIDSNTSKSTTEGAQGASTTTVSNTSRTVTNGPSFALTWGTQMGDFAPWARIGFRANDLSLTDNETRSPAGTTADYRRYSSNSALEISGGASYNLSETSSVGGEIRFGSTFPEKEERGLTVPGPINTPDVTNRRGGAVGFGIGGYYRNTLDFGAVAIGFSPNLNFALTTRSNSWDGDSGSFLTFGDRWTTLDAGVDFGVRWKLREKITLYTGVNLQVFDWTTWGETGEHYNANANNSEARRSSWRFDGFDVNGPEIGMTFTPTENIVVGLGMNSFIEGLFGNATGFPNFDFTISAKLGSKERAGNEERAAARAERAAARTAGDAAE